MRFVRAVIDGRVVAADARLALAAGYGHFTAMQVRDRRVRGLDLHLDRLDAANAELFGEPVDRARVLDSIRAALGDDLRDAGIRVHVLAADRPHLIATAAAPIDASPRPQRVRSYVYQRFLPHIKSVGGIQQTYLMRRAALEGADHALLTSADGLISEGAVTNLGCLSGGRLIWPQAPMLAGITMGLLRRAGFPQERRPLKVADLEGHDLVFLSSARGLSPVGQVDEFTLNPDEKAFARLLAALDDTPWDPLD
ncbi:class IV aminotransferase [Nonomuraea sp. NN258]|uniref:aminotransferase class IV n=1 Tax=Nonomuraea antri TaxID=2730852 RepID=UPI00156A61E5|nr:aminotransferase class IV [Nonomuraea antri]NRQ37609.1 class IV aminotransferase [Nonomuraea antri]